MNTLFTGKHFIYLDKISSTNTYASALSEEETPEGTVVYSPIQESGKGRGSKQWYSEPYMNLTFSVIYYPRFLSPNDIFYLSKMTSVALLKGIRSLLPEELVEIKWPNDLLVNRRKIGGILIENQVNDTQVRSSVIGIGMNVNQKSFPDNFSYQATSLGLCNDKEYDTDKVLEHLLTYLEVEYLALREGKRQRLDFAYLQSLYGYQENVSVDLKGVVKSLPLVGVDSLGRLALQCDDRLHFYDMESVKLIMEV